MRLLLLFVLLLAGAALGLYGYKRAADGTETVYMTRTVEKGDIVHAVAATGTLKALVTVDVGSQLSGQVAALLADFNDEVTAKQPIARLDDRTFAARVEEAQAVVQIAQANLRVRKANVERTASDLARTRASLLVLRAEIAVAKARHDNAGADLARKQALRKKGATSERDLQEAAMLRATSTAELQATQAKKSVQGQEIAMAQADQKKAEAEVQSAEANLAEARAALRRARLELDRTVIRSPIDGVVIARNVDKGQTVAASLEAPTLFKIAQDLRQMEVHANIDEADIGRIRLGQEARFGIDAYPGRVFTGTVKQMRKAPEVVQNVVTYTVVVSTRNDEQLLLPGMTALIQFVVEQRRNVLKLPNAAPRYRPKDDAIGARGGRLEPLPPDGAGGRDGLVWIIKDGGPAPIRIRTGMADDSTSEVSAGGLADGQAVIVAESTRQEDDGLFGLGIQF
ncbi:MAG: efflux RND transporter periplasmic adaptor subunit [Alphaproteobacteria bacterium]|nr:efflux RND transporter periplasmic adaptor subunit [Alphaproteobacteria bacterium]